MSPGPTPMPARRNRRTKWTTLASSDIGHRLRRRAGDLREVVLVLQEHAERRLDRLRRQHDRTERDERVAPVERLRDARQLEQVTRAQPLDERDDLAAQLLRHLRRARREDRELAFRARIVDPVIQTAPLDRVVDLAGPVRRHAHDRRHSRLDRPVLRDRDLEVRQELEQERLERLVGAIELVEQQHRCARRIRHQRLEQWPPQQEPLAVQPALDRLGMEPDLEHLLREVPLVQRRARIEPFVALQPDQPPAERAGHRLRDLGLADAGFALEQHRLTEDEREVQRRRELAIREVLLPREQLGQIVDARRHLNADCTARFAITPTRCARYAALASVSLIRSSAGTVMPAIASGANDFASAASIAGTRNTDGAAPVTATRTPADVSATISPTTANFEARWANFSYAARFAAGTCTAVTISSRSSAVSNKPLKKSSAAILRRSVAIVAPSATSAAGYSAAGSACAIDPPIVPRLRTCASPIQPASPASAGTSLRTTGDS